MTSKIQLLGSVQIRYRAALEMYAAAEESGDQNQIIEAEMILEDVEIDLTFAEEGWARANSPFI